MKLSDTIAGVVQSLLEQSAATEDEIKAFQHVLDRVNYRETHQICPECEQPNYDGEMCDNCGYLSSTVFAAATDDEPGGTP